MRMRTRNRLAAMALGSVLALGSTACGLEGLVVELLTDDPILIEVPPGALSVAISGGFTGEATLYLFDLAGQQLATATVPADGGAIEVPSEAAIGTLRIVAISGNQVVKGIYFCLTPETLDSPHQIEVNAASTAATLVVEALGTFRGYSDLIVASEQDPQTVWALKSYALKAYTDDEIKLAYETVLADLEAEEPAAAAFLNQVEAVLRAGSGSSSGTPMFPPAADSMALLQSAFLTENSVDYDEDGTEDIDPAAFNDAAEALAAALRPELLEAIPGLTAPDGDATDGTTDDYQLIPVIFTVHASEGLPAGDCSTLKFCGSKGIGACADGETMFFTGGVHKESPIQDSSLHASLGSFIPNLVQMYDDGINGGDEVAGDAIFTLTVTLPKGLRIGYKYTWGLYNDPWTGTEEWPGNQRLLEVIDVNGDGYVWRDDNMVDETTNKDKSNCYGGICDKFVTWTTDLNADGYLEAQEHPLAFSVEDAELGTASLTGSCVFNDWVQPTRTPRATPGLQCE